MKKTRLMYLIGLSFVLTACSGQDFVASEGIDPDETVLITTTQTPTTVEEEDVPTTQQRVSEENPQTLEAFEIIVANQLEELALLEERFIKIQDEDEIFQELRHDSQLLNDRVTQVNLSYGAYWWEHFERICIEDGGTYVLPDTTFWGNLHPTCSFESGVESVSENTGRRERLEEDFERLFGGLNTIIFAVWFDDLDGFSDHIDELEVRVQGLNARVGIRIDELETENPELWQNFFEFFWETEQLAEDAVMNDLLLEASELSREVNGVMESILRYTNANIDDYPGCGHTETMGSECRQFMLIEVRLRNIRELLNGINHRHETRG